MNSANSFAALNADQRRAFLDLLIVAMYVDGHLASIEDAWLRRLLGRMGFNSDYDCNRELDGSITRVRSHISSPESAQSHAVKLARGFGTEDARQLVSSALEEFMTCDSELSPEENRLLAAARQLLGS